MVNIFKQWQAAALSILVAAVILVIGVLFFMTARMQMEDQIRERLQSTAAAAALSMDGDMLDRVRGPTDVEKPEYQEAIRLLDGLRRLPDIRFAYILRATEDPMVLEFIADADAVLSTQDLDVNGNGRVDADEEPAYPGEQYEVSEVPALQHDAFVQPTTDAEITIDQWGALISGYAPIYRVDGTVSAVLGIDMDAEDYLRLSQSVFSPAAFLLLSLEALLLGGFVAFLWERRQIIILRRINNERSGLLRLTFHQLGEPLTIMKWSLETLREETQSPELKKLVDEHVVCMDEGLGRLNSIIDILQLAEKVDLDTLQYLPVPASLRALIDNAVNEWSSSLQKREQHMHVLMQEDIQMPLDATLMTLVLRQLIVNAIEYSPEKSDISISVYRVKGGVRLVIQDQGCGIPHQDMVHIFEKYRRAGNAHLIKPDGNGLGLYITKGIVEKAGGSISIASEEHKGTTVTVMLPVK